MPVNKRQLDKDPLISEHFGGFSTFWGGTFDDPSEEILNKYHDLGIDLKNDLKEIDEEVFGPILHIVRYSSDKMDNLVDEINNLNYGLTLGIHSRIDSTINFISNNVNVGNIYINRNITGAVVGSQPFGGRGLSGTGPKAGGPNYLLNLLNEKTLSNDITASGGNTSLLMLSDEND
mgnify:CR=1 FL=1